MEAMFERGCLFVERMFASWLEYRLELRKLDPVYLAVSGSPLASGPLVRGLPGAEELGDPIDMTGKDVGTYEGRHGPHAII